MATKIEMIVRITDSELGVAETAVGVTGYDLADTGSNFIDLVFMRGVAFAEKAMENPKFVVPVAPAPAAPVVAAPTAAIPAKFGRGKRK